MKAVTVTQMPGGEAPQLTWEETSEVPSSPGIDEVLVDIYSTAVNRADLLQARGKYDPPSGASSILGLEMAGRVSNVGANVTAWKIGDRVAALLSGGGYAEKVAVPADMLLRLPASMNFDTAAAIPEAWITAFLNLFIEGNLVESDTVLIHAGASGVGTAAIQLAHHTGSRVAVTSSSERKLELCRQLGADLLINYKSENFSERISEFTSGKGADLILDLIGGTYLAPNIAALAPLGRLVFIGLLGGRTAELDLGVVMQKRLKLIGSVLRSRARLDKASINREFCKHAWGHLCSGKFRPIVDRVFPIDAVYAAHEYVRSNGPAGKVVLHVKDELLG